MLDESALSLIDAAVKHQLQKCDGDSRRCLESLATGELEAWLEWLGRTLAVPTDQVPGMTGTQHGESAGGPIAGAIDLPATVADSEPPDQGETTVPLDELPSNGTAYQILRPLARGGLGEVFVAQDTKLNREVALKIIQSSVAANAQEMARFLQEAEITGGLEHPGIVPIYALGRNSDGRPYYTMRLVKGMTLEEQIRGSRRSGSPRPTSLEFHQQLNHFVRVCEIVAYAHSRGVLHRDLKPANIMLGKYGETLVVDWGLAKSIDQPEQEHVGTAGEAKLKPASGSSLNATIRGKAMGTPKFMSPEQALGQVDKISFRTDIYGLGATLYCILTRKAPLSGVDNVGEILERVARGEIAFASQVVPWVPVTLCEICRKAMAVHPEDRYESAQALADDVEHWLADEPPRGVSESVGNRLGRWERKHRTLIRVGGLAMAAVTLVSIAAAIGINSARQRAEERRLRAIVLGEAAETQRQLAAIQRDEAQRLSTRLTLDRALALLEAGEHRAGLLWLVRGLKTVNRLDQGGAIERVIRMNLEGWSHAVHRLRACIEQQGRVGVVVTSPTGGCFATGNEAGQVQLWDPVTGSPLSPVMVHPGPVRLLAFSPDGTILATGCEDQTARFWNPATGLARGEPMRHRGPVTSLAFTPNGRSLITGSSDGMIRVWSTMTSQLEGPPWSHGQPVEKILITANGKTVISGGEAGSVRLWNVGDPQPRSSLPGLRGSVRVIALSPDGTLLATATDDRRLRLWRVDDGELLATSKEPVHGEAILDLAFSPDGSRLGTGSYDTSSRIFRVPDLEPLASPLKHRGHVWAIAFSPDGSMLAVATDDKQAQIWDTASYEKVGDMLPHSQPVRAVAFGADGRTIVTGCDDGVARIWELGRGLSVGLPMDHHAEVRVLAVRPDGLAVATGTSNGILRLWDATTTRLIARQTAVMGSDRLQDLQFSGNDLLVTAGQDGQVRRWNGKTLEPIGTPIKLTHRVRRVVLSPDGAMLAAGDQLGHFGFWDLRTGRVLASPTPLARAVTALAFNHDGTRLFVGDSQGDGQIWDMTNFKPIGDPIRHSGSIQSAVFSPEGQRLATASYDMTARLWNVETQKPIGEPMRHRGYVWSVQFHPDGRRVLTGSFDATAQLWDASTGRALGEPMNHGELVYGARFSPDGMMVLSYGRSPLGRLWDASTSRPLGMPLGHHGAVHQAAFVPGRPLIATVSADKTARLWKVPSMLTHPAGEIAEQMEIMTGMELGDDNVVHVLDASSWKAHRATVEHRLQAP